MIQTKTIFKLLCYLPYYFLLMIAIGMWFGNDDLFNAPPPPPPGVVDFPSVSTILDRVLYSHIPALIGYMVISFPFVIFLLVWLFRNNEPRKMLFIHLSFYLISLIATLFSVEILKLIK